MKRGKTSTYRHSTCKTRTRWRNAWSKM